MDTSKIDRFVGEQWDDEIVPQLVEYIRIPNKSPMFDADWVQHGYMDDAVELMEALGARAADPGHAGRGGAPGRPHAADLHRHPGGQRRQQRRLRAALRPPRQAAGDDRLGPTTSARGSRCIKGDKLYGRGGADDGYAIFGSLTAILRAAGAGLPHCALRDPDRGLRGIRQLRPARLRRPPRRPHRQAVAGGVPGLGLRQLRPAVVHDLAARPGRRQPHGQACSAKACTPATPPASCRRASACCASCCRASRTRPPARSCSRTCTSRFPAERLAQAQRSARRCSAPRSTTSSRSCPAWCRWRDDLTELVLNRTWRPALSVTGADGMPPLSTAGNVLRPLHRR